MNIIADLGEFTSQNKNIDELKSLVKTKPEYNSIYPESLHELNGSILFLIKTKLGKELIVTGSGSSIFNELEGEIHSEKGIGFKNCPLSVANSKVIQKYFPFTNPVSLGDYDVTIGLGDRLGLASVGHLKLMKGLKARPVLAQQSIRELNFTGRNYSEVLADVVWAVFQENYQGGFGADGDHLKTFDDIKMALNNGFTMITLDCSEHIHNLQNEEQAEIDKIYLTYEPNLRQYLETWFLGKEFKIAGMNLFFTPEQFRLNVVIYQKAIDFAIKVYNELIRPYGNIDFEISIDETATPTHPLAHFFVAKQLTEAGVKINSLAPRFCGEFQKGIDYVGDLNKFKQEYIEHEQIADYFRYKLSIHSGSDKFRVFPIIGHESKRFHLKTAGTNWLEAVRVVIEKEPILYRDIHTYALKHLEEAKKYYHISADPNKIPNVYKLSDSELKDLMDLNDARQVIHITYGLILQAKDEKGNYLFKNKIFNCLHKNEDLYAHFLQKHIGNHLKKLGFF
jgi:hypothetical protein